jgi:hypothetical protein
MASKKTIINIAPYNHKVIEESTRMQRQPFDRRKYIYHSEEFVELVKDAVRFFNGTPVHPLPLQE